MIIPWPQIAAALLIANVVTGYLWRSASSELALAEARADVAVEHNTAIVAKQDAITEEMKNGWKAAVDYLRAHPQRVLDKTCGRGVSGVPGTAPGADGAGESPVPAPERVEEDAAEDVLKLNQLQTWIEKQRGIK